MAAFALLLDACVDGRVDGALQRWGYDALRIPHTGAANPLSDPQVVALGAVEGRVILTNDAATMLTDFCAYRAAGHDHPGLLIAVQRRPIKEYLRSLHHTLETTPPEDLHNNYLWLKYGAPAGGAE